LGFFFSQGFVARNLDLFFLGQGFTIFLSSFCEGFYFCKGFFFGEAKEENLTPQVEHFSMSFCSCCCWNFLFVFLPHPIEKVVSLSRVNGHSLWL
jgi:hypothetical protein